MRTHPSSSAFWMGVAADRTPASGSRPPWGRSKGAENQSCHCDRLTRRLPGHATREDPSEPAWHDLADSLLPGLEGNASAKGAIG